MIWSIHRTKHISLFVCPCDEPASSANLIVAAGSNALESTCHYIRAEQAKMAPGCGTVSACKS